MKQLKSLSSTNLKTAATKHKSDMAVAHVDIRRCVMAYLHGKTILLRLDLIVQVVPEQAGRELKQGAGLIQTMNTDHEYRP